MAGPGRKTDYARRTRAFEMFASGLSKAAIARELRVTRQSVQNWCKADGWEKRLYAVATDAEESAKLGMENAVADIMVQLRLKLMDRLRELDRLCRDENPSVRRAAINDWLRLAGVKQAFPTPNVPLTPKGLELIDDLTNPSTEHGLDELNRAKHALPDLRIQEDDGEG